MGQFVKRRGFLRAWRAISLSILRVLLALFVVAWVMSTDDAMALDSATYVLAARVHREDATLRVTERIELEVPIDQTTLRLWFYAKRLEHVPSGLNDINARWIYPGEIDRGRVRVDDLTVDGSPVHWTWHSAPPHGPLGADKAGAEITIPLGVGREGRHVRIGLKFELYLPERFGRLGNSRSQLSLAAPWYPLVLDRAGDLAPAASHHVSLRTSEPSDIYAHGRLFRNFADVRARGDYLPFVIAPTLHRLAVTASGCRMRFISSKMPYRPPPSHAPGEAGLVDLVRIDTVGRIRDALDEVCGTLNRLRLPSPRDFDVLEVPSRTELVGTAPGVVLVSDRLFEIFPIRQALAFHQSALRQVLFQHAVEPWSDRLEATRDRAWARELRARVLNAFYEAKHDGTVERPNDLIGFAGFHPAVDQLLYAPQIAFEEVYFSPGELSPFRDDPERARMPWAHGAKVLENARLLLSRREFSRFVMKARDTKESVRRALLQVAPRAKERLSIWLTYPLRPVNYRLGHAQSVRLKDGRYRHRVQVFRDGAYRSEPVDVKVTDADGNDIYGVWAGDTASGSAELFSDAPLEDAELDPYHKLSQSSELSPSHPRHDDASSHPWRPPLLQAFAFDVLLPDYRVQGFVDFGLRKRYNLEDGVGFRLGTDPASTGGSVRYEHGFGPKVHDNRRSGTISGSLGLSRLHSDFSDKAQGGWRGTVGLGASINTRRYLVDPRSGSSLATSVSLSGVGKDQGGFGLTVSSGIRGNLTFPLGLKNTVVIVGGVAGTLHPVLDADRQALGGRFLLRAFQTDELLGDARGFLVLEHRFTAISDLSWNLLHLAWLRELELAWFVGSGVLYGSANGETWSGAAEAGLGVRFLYEYGGIQPGVLAIDWAVPLTRQNDALVRDGQVVRRYSPISVYVSFDQYF